MNVQIAPRSEGVLVTSRKAKFSADFLCCAILRNDFSRKKVQRLTSMRNSEMQDLSIFAENYNSTFGLIIFIRAERFITAGLQAVSRRSAGNFVARGVVIKGMKPDCDTL